MPDLENDWVLLRQDRENEVSISVLFHRANSQLKVKVQKGNDVLDEIFDASADPISFVESKEIAADAQKAGEIANKLVEKLEVGLE